jgi:hypothetical protein
MLPSLSYLPLPQFSKSAPGGCVRQGSARRPYVQGNLTYATDAIRVTDRAYINVADIEEAFVRTRAIAPNRLESSAVIVEGPFRFFRVRDPDNNVLEFFSIDQAPSGTQ